jgi:unsaturated rhamnogalacturonyl hydrolase
MKRFLAAALLVLTGSAAITAQTATTLEQTKGVGDAPEAAPAAQGISSAMQRKAVKAAMKKVADWELARSRPWFSQDWTFGALYAGFMAASKTLGDATYENAMIEMGKKFEWQLGPRLTHADDQAVAQTYMELYLKHHDPVMMGPAKARFDELMKLPDEPGKPVWWWCDALFMAPPVWARLYAATQDKAYLDTMDREWWITSKLLYDNQEHLYFRDAKYLERKEANGKKLFWSRGNGWVMGGLARVLEYMPKDYPTRAKYVAQLQEMAAKMAEIQSADGLWRPGLLDAGAYPLPETSGSAFAVYAMAWGINRGILDRGRYLPVVKKGWAGLIAHVYGDGRLGSMQPIGEKPGEYRATASYVYGVGAFLLAGSEVVTLAR